VEQGDEYCEPDSTSEMSEVSMQQTSAVFGELLGKGESQ
jgi:hypothetical protein